MKKHVSLKDCFQNYFHDLGIVRFVPSGHETSWRTSGQTSGPDVAQTLESESLDGRLDQTSKQTSGPDVLADVSIKMSMRCSIKPKPILPEDGTEV